MATSVSFSWQGQKLNVAVKKAMRQAGEDVLRAAVMPESINEVPIEEGTLGRSITVTVGALPDPSVVFSGAQGGSDMKEAYPQPIGDEDAVYLSANTPYARRQHEETDYHHDAGRKAKYLEDPFNRNATQDKIDIAVQRRLREAGV